MKKLILSISLGLFALNLSAQTYNGGTWYSLYDTKTISNVVIGSDFGEQFSVFSPVGDTYSLQYEKYSKASTTGKLAIFMTSDGKNWIKTGTQSDITNTHVLIGDKHDWKTYNGTIDSKLNHQVSKVKFQMVDGTGLMVRNVFIPLAQHILLAEGTYGTTAYAEPFDFGSIQWGETAEGVDEIALRSFLTNGNITITSSEPSVFRINSADNTEGTTYNVGANACASANGAAEQVCADGVLGDINLYGFKIYFCPQEAKEYNGTITITDGTSTATVAVKGTGLKHDQTITFAPETAIFDSATIAPATVSSNLELSYTFAPEGIITWDGSKLAIAPVSAPTQVTITVAQDGNDYYNAATPVEQTLTISPSVVYGKDSAVICSGDSVKYNEVWYKEGVYENILLPEKNIYGSDSIVTFTVNTLPTYLFPEEETHTLAETFEWHGKEIAHQEGEYDLVDSLKTLAGCDSVYTLHLTLTKAEQTITFELEDNTIMVGGQVRLSATTDIDGLDITYQYNAEDPLVNIEKLISIEGSILTALNEGTVVITALQEGNDIYAPAQAQQTLYIVNNATDIDEVSDNQPIATKFIHNGQLIIRRNEHLYNVTGIELH